MQRRTHSASWSGTSHERAVASLYAAATGEGDWASSLDDLASALSFETATMYVHDRRAVSFDPQRPVVRRGLWHRLDPEGEASYRERYFRVDPRVAYTLKHPGTRLLYDHLYCSEDELRDGPYRRWYRRATGMEYSLGGHVGTAQPFFGSISLHRRRGGGPSTPAEHRQFGVLFGHMERALLVEYRLSQAQQAQSGFAALAEGNAHGVVFLDALGGVLHANPRARAYAERGDGFTLGRRIEAKGGGDAALQRAIGAAVQGQAVQPVRLRRAGQEAYVVLATPVTQAAMPGLFEVSTVAACLIVTDPAEQGDRSARCVQEAFGLTAAETRLVARLSAGTPLSAIAVQSGLSVNTLRSQMAAVFRKTGANRQQDVVRLVHELSRDRL